MSELAYDWQHRQRYGCGIDEDPPLPDEDAAPEQEEESEGE